MQTCKNVVLMYNNFEWENKVKAIVKEFKMIERDKYFQRDMRSIINGRKKIINNILCLKNDKRKIEHNYKMKFVKFLHTRMDNYLNQLLQFLEIYDKCLDDNLTELFFSIRNPSLLEEYLSIDK